MFHIALFEPEIPPNTGNIIRLCANLGFQLHLIEPLGFDMDEKKVRRAGLDYHEWANVKIHPNYAAFKQAVAGQRIFAMTTKGSQNYANMQYQKGDVFLMGPETRGLPESVRNELPENQRIRLPMTAESRSLNLSNATAVIAYEAWRQAGFEGGA
jgi:tRNA (cytidine/uridine-2'-O-)-methyltransferase